MTQPAAPAVTRDRCAPGYGLLLAIIGSGNVNFCPITQEKYCEIENSKEGLIELLNIEEKFDVALQNYIELETTMLDLAVRHSVTFHFGPEMFQDTRAILDRRILNFLSACRFYIDQLKHHLSAILKDDIETLSVLTATLSEAYDANLSYRVMEALRNYVQHRGFPLYGVSYSGEWLNSWEKLRHVVIPTINPTQLRKDGKFKIGVLNELLALTENQKKETLNLTPFIRGYMEALGNVHVHIRNALSERATSWDQCFNDAIALFAENNPGQSTTGLAAVLRAGDCSWTEQIDIFHSLIDLRTRLSSKNHNFEKLAKRFVSSEITRD